MHELLHEYVVYRGLHVDSPHESGGDGASAMEVDGGGAKEGLRESINRGGPCGTSSQQQQQQQQQQGDADVMEVPWEGNCLGEVGASSCPSRANDAAVEGIGRLSVGGQMRWGRGGNRGKEAQEGGRDGWEPDSGYGTGVDGQQGGGTHKARQSPCSHSDLANAAHFDRGHSDSLFTCSLALLSCTLRALMLSACCSLVCQESGHPLALGHFVVQCTDLCDPTKMKPCIHAEAMLSVQQSA
eukprot:1158824-Pelagomonas_calceolata.AAC.1